MKLLRPINKIIFCLWIALSIGLAGCGDDELVEQVVYEIFGPEPHWAKTYGGNDSDTAGAVTPTSDGGFIVVGTTESFGAGINDWLVIKINSNGDILWQKTFGGTERENAHAVQQTSDGGFIVAGNTSTWGAGNYDWWLIKFDPDGNIEWQRAYGGIFNDGSNSNVSIQQTTDGGYIVTSSNTSFAVFSPDILTMKLDSSGNIEWQKTYGTQWFDRSRSVHQTADGGYIIAGETYLTNFWIIKTDPAGNIEWRHTYGGIPSNAIATSIRQTTDGGYIVAGFTRFIGAGLMDFWILKLDPIGNITWQKTYGGPADDAPFSIRQTLDGGFIVAGVTESFGEGNYDAWIIKLYENGEITWEKTYGGAGDDMAGAIEQTSDGGYIVAGQTDSFGAGDTDLWVLRLRPDGNISSDALPGLGADTFIFGQDTATTPGNSLFPVSTLIPTAESNNTSATVTDSNAVVQTQASD